MTSKSSSHIQADPRSTGRGIPSLAGLTFAALLVASCGGSDDSAPPPPFAMRGGSVFA